jgi:hypothetical protein
MRRLITATVLSFFFACCAFGQQCGGQERWAVKDGTDPAASQVDFSNIQATTIPDLAAIPKPQIVHDDVTRAIPEETVVVRVKAHLIKWKMESDNDYHLVLTDDTLEFTSGRKNANGHSLIGEIPDTDCLSGSNGDFGTDSPFLDVGPGRGLGMGAARDQMKAAFSNPDLSGGWNDAGGVNVEVVGVQFFDRAHGQTGRAPNGLEIHPILSIKFLDNASNLSAAAAVKAPKRPRALVAPGGGAMRNAPASSIQDPKSGETATVTEDRALVVAASEHSGKSGLLNTGVSSPNLGFPKSLTVCWFSGAGPGTVQISMDSKNWFDVEATIGSNCKAVPPAAFVKLTATKGVYQVSY